MSENRCVMCGDIIPEGRMVCHACENKIENNKTTTTLKLFQIYYMDDCEEYDCLMVAENEESVKKRFEKEVFDQLPCPMDYSVFEVNEVDGHIIFVD